MIRQKPVTSKTATATLTYSEMGDVVVNSSSATTITLPSPLSGCWYRVVNIGTGTVSVYYGSTLATLAQYSHVLALANGTSGWWVAKGLGAITKSEVEAVLTGEISTHTHADNVLSGASAPTTATVGTLGQLYLETTTPKAYICTAVADPVYTWDELGGGGAATFIELNDVPSTYSGQGGKLVKVNSGETGLEFGDAPASTFTGLSDTPSSYSGAAGKIVRVNSTPDGLVFDDVPVVVILGMYATLTDLQTAHPTGTAGDAYAVGTSTSNEIYIWDPDTTAWVSIGDVKGPQGADGASAETFWGGM